MVGQAPRAARGRRGLPAPSAGSIAGLDRRWRNAAIGRASALLGLPLAIAIIGGQPEHFAPLARLYREAAGRAGYDPALLPVSINSHTYVAETSQQAGDEYFPIYAAMMNRIGRERGWPPMGRRQFEMGRPPRGSARRRQPGGGRTEILFEHELFGHKRFMAQISVGALPHEKVMNAIELFGTGGGPAVRKEIEPIDLERRRTGSHLSPARGSTPMAGNSGSNPE